MADTMLSVCSKKSCPQLKRAKPLTRGRGEAWDGDHYEQQQHGYGRENLCVNQSTRRHVRRDWHTSCNGSSACMRAQCKRDTTRSTHLQRPDPAQRGLVEAGLDARKEAYDQRAHDVQTYATQAKQLASDPRREEAGAAERVAPVKGRQLHEDSGAFSDDTRTHLIRCSRSSRRSLRRALHTDHASRNGHARAPLQQGRALARRWLEGAARGTNRFATATQLRRSRTEQPGRRDTGAAAPCVPSSLQSNPEKTHRRRIRTRPP
jgi:hypothetical protein